ncbi:MAG: mltG [Naasia sp.]|nr:mltG [Naasia sp.]
MPQPPRSPENLDTTPVPLPSWADIVDGPVETPASRRGLKDREAAHAAGRVRTRRKPEQVASYGFPDTEPPRRRRRWAPWVIAPLVLLLVLGGGGVAAAFLIMPDWPDRISGILAGPEETDYAGSGQGEVDVVIHSGDVGSDIAVTLQQAGVTKTFEAFYDLLLMQEPEPVFQPGMYRLKEQMSAQAALDALTNPVNKLENQVLIIEGESLPNALELISAGTRIPLEELQAAAADVGSFGLPPGAMSLEGFLFPATYEFDPGLTAHDALQRMVNRSTAALDELGVPAEDRFRVVTLASVVQREAGPYVPDMAKIARVFQNRIDQGINLQSDATVAYGTGNTDTVWTTDAERADASNLYNTYANPGLPVGPIGNPGMDALNAALHPAEGPWMFFVPVNLATGETVFSVTADEHEANAQRLRDWCNANDENAAYCG